MSTLIAARTNALERRSLLVVVGAMMSAIVIGVAVAAKAALGIALLVGLVFAAVAVYAPIYAMAGFVPLVFLEAISALNTGGKAAGLLLTAAWLAAIAGGRLDIGPFVRRNRRLVECLALMVVWMLLTALWAVDPHAVLSEIWHWIAVALLFMVLATWIRSTQVLVWVCVAFVVGAVLSVAVGLATGMSETMSAGASDPRLSGGVGDPNFLAAGLIPGIVIAGGLIFVVRKPLARWGLVVAIAICAYGIAASQSRGGLLALIFVVFAALFGLRRKRIYVTVAVLGLVALGAVYFTVQPAAWNRISDIESNGSGRSGLWTVAWRVGEEHPVAGVGLANYPHVAKNYTRRPGSLTDVRKIAEEPNVVHNTYLQAFAETGIIGLALFLFFALGCCRAAWKAGRRLEEAGRFDMAALAQCILVATVGMLAAIFFVSAAVDQSLWILFALGPAALSVASRESAPEPSADGVVRPRVPRPSPAASPGY